MIRSYALLIALCGLVILLLAAPGFARVDKVYHPYVTPLEREMEWRLVFERHPKDTVATRQRHRFAYGQSVNERLFLEAYAIVDHVAGQGFAIEGYELESQIQLSEQGEFWADWGLLLELEREARQDVWESGLGLLLEKELGRWSTAVNGISVYEFGSDKQNEWLSEAAVQLRYRLSPGFEPALEFYWDEKNQGLGPAVRGLRRFGRNKLKWEFALVFTRGESSSGQSFRSLLEYEF